LCEARLAGQLWLQAGNASCASNVMAFFLDLWEARPRHRRLLVPSHQFCIGTGLQPVPPALSYWWFPVASSLTGPIISPTRRQASGIAHRRGLDAASSGGSSD
jgi:hypothetical protein